MNLQKSCTAKVVWLKSAHMSLKKLKCGLKYITEISSLEILVEILNTQLA